MHQSRKVLLFVSLVFIVLLACGQSVEQGDLPNSNNDTNNSSILVENNSSDNGDSGEEPTNEPVKTPTPIPPTSTPLPTPEPTEAPFGGRLNPVPVGQPISLILDGDMNFNLTVLEVLRGDSAWSKIIAANMFNDEAPEYMEYVLVYLSLEYTSCPSDKVLELNSYDFNVVSNYQVLDNPSVVDPEPVFDISLFSGGAAEGYIAVLVWETDRNPLLEVDRNSWTDDEGFFFELTPNFDASEDFSYIPNIFTSAVTGMGTRTNPVPIGSFLPLIIDDKQDFTVSISEVIRGNDAWVMIEDANMFNDEAPENMEYVLAYIVVEYLSGPLDEVLSISEYDIDVVSNSQILDNPYVVSPEPEFDIILYPGGIAGGWAPVLVYIDDSSPVLGLSLGYSSDSFYFALSQ